MVAPAGQGEGAGAAEPGHRLAPLAVVRRLAVGAGPLHGVVEPDDRLRFAPVGAGPAAVGVHDGPVGQLPVPHPEEAVVELELEPQPQGAAAVVTDTPGVVPLADPAVDLVHGVAHGVGAGVGPGLQDVALVPHHLVVRPHGAAPQAVGLGPGPEGEVEPDGGDAGIGPQPQLLEGPDHLDAGAPDVGGVRIAVVGSTQHAQQRRPVDPAHLDRVHDLAGREVGHGEEHDVAPGIGSVQLEEVALAPVRAPGLDVGQELGDLVDEQLVQAGGPRHLSAPRPGPSG